MKTIQAYLIIFNLLIMHNELTKVYVILFKLKGLTAYI